MEQLRDEGKMRGGMEQLLVGRSGVFPPKWGSFPSNTVLSCIRAVLALIHVL